MDNSESCELLLNEFVLLKEKISQVDLLCSIFPLLSLAYPHSVPHRSRSCGSNTSSLPSAFLRLIVHGINGFSLAVTKVNTTAHGLKPTSMRNQQPKVDLPSNGECQSELPIAREPPRTP